MHDLVELAYIESTSLGYEDHGILTSFLMLKGEDGSWGQGFGGYILSGPAMSAWIKGVLDAVGVEDWKDLVGKYVWLTRDTPSLFGSKIVSIKGVGKGRKLPEFDPVKTFESLKEKAAA